jgi:8-oxo-dGTP pyrophosphatase MutT (NUDIX family)
MAKVKFFDKLGNSHEFEEKEAIYRRGVYGYVEVDGKILMVKDVRVGRWELPGGAVDPGENDEEALIREIMEETGLKVKKIGKLIKNKMNNYYSLGDNAPWKSDRYFYLVELEDIKEGILHSGNGQDTTGAKLLFKDEIKNLIVGEDDLEIIKLMGRGN